MTTHPLQSRLGPIKTDKVDAFVLATLLRLDFLPRVWRPDLATQQARRISAKGAPRGTEVVSRILCLGLIAGGPRAYWTLTPRGLNASEKLLSAS